MSEPLTPFGCEPTVTSSIISRGVDFITLEFTGKCVPVKKPRVFTGDNYNTCIMCGYNVYDEMHHANTYNLELL